MLLECIAIIVACTLVSQPGQSDVTRPTVHMQVLNARPVVGEPLVVDFVVSNETQEEICTPPPLSIEGGLVEFILYAHSGADFVGRSISGWFCGKRPGVFKFDGHCTEILEPGQQLRGHGFAVLLASEDKNIYGRPTSVPLDPGHYTLTGKVRWGNWSLQTDSVQIEIVAPRTQHEILASESVDAIYAIFVSSYVTVGLGKDLMPAESVKAILEQCPDSVHARLARSRLLVLQAHKLKSRRSTTDEQREADKQQMIDVVSRIDVHLRTHHDDPLELDLMDGKIQLLRRLQKEDKLRQAIDALAAKYPLSGRTRRAQKMWKQIHSNPTDRE